MFLYLKVIKRQILSDKQTFSSETNDLFGAITALMQSYNQDSRKIHDNNIISNLHILIDSEQSRIKQKEELPKKTAGKTLIEKVKEKNSTNQEQKEELTTLPGRFSNTISFNYQLPEQESIDHRTIFAYKPEEKVQMYEEETNEKKESSSELQAVSKEVIQRMTMREISKAAPEYKFMEKYVSPEDKERYAAFKMINKAKADNIQLGMWLYGSAPI